MKTALKFDSIAVNGHFTFSLRVYDPEGWFMYHIGTLWADRVLVSFQPPYFIVTLFMGDNVHFIAVVDEIDLSAAPPGIREKFQGARVDVRAEVL
jgi:hypothetical protein